MLRLDALSDPVLARRNSCDHPELHDTISAHLPAMVWSCLQACSWVFHLQATNNTCLTSRQINWLMLSYHVILCCFQVDKQDFLWITLWRCVGNSTFCESICDLLLLLLSLAISDSMLELGNWPKVWMPETPCALWHVSLHLLTSLFSEIMLHDEARVSHYQNIQMSLMTAVWWNSDSSSGLLSSATLGVALQPHTRPVPFRCDWTDKPKACALHSWLDWETPCVCTCKSWCSAFHQSMMRSGSWEPYSMQSHMDALSGDRDWFWAPILALP